MARPYDQYCPLAWTLDRVGERWTPLILRDLAAGPKRYSDLLGSLSGVGTSMLADRLRRLEDEGLVARRELGPPTPAKLYELTPLGRDLFRTLLPLAAWGAKHMSPPPPDADIRPESGLMTLHATFRPERAQGIHDIYEFRIGADVFTLEVDDGELRSRVGASAVRPDVVVIADWRTLFDVAYGRQSPDDAQRDGGARVEGDPAAVERCYELFGPARLGIDSTAAHDAARR